MFSKDGRIQVNKTESGSGSDPGKFSDPDPKAYNTELFALKVKVRKAAANKSNTHTSLRKVFNDAVKDEEASTSITFR